MLRLLLRKRWLVLGRRLGLLLGGLVLLLPTAYATDMDSGEYEPMPTGTDALLVYYKGARHNQLYTDGSRAFSDAEMNADITVLRAVRFMEVASHVVAPQAILPVGRLQAAGDLSAMGEADGIGDLLLPLPVFLLNDSQRRRYFAINPIFYLPTGDYDNDKALNIGENRWKVDLQAGYVGALSERWNLDLTVGVKFFGDNKDFGTDSQTLQQDELYQFQGYLSYLRSSKTRYALGYSRLYGGQTRIDGASRDDTVSTHRASLSAAHFYTPKDQLLISLGRDFSVRNGVKEDVRLTLRFLHIL